MGLRGKFMAYQQSVMIRHVIEEDIDISQCKCKSVSQILREI